MLTNMNSAAYDTETGTIKVLLPNTTVNGYQNTVNQYQTPNTLSIPLEGLLVNLDIQCPTQMQTIGYQSSIIDENYTIVAGEFTSYSINWYLSTRNSGVEIQKADTANKENMMMGQSTNAVLIDIMSLIIELITWAGNHTHLYAPGSGSPTPTATALPVPPSDSDVINDKTYIQNNKNLAITGTYEPK